MCYAKESMASKPPAIASSLNPKAPAFVPAAFQAAEDFSPEWWRLIQTNNSFREWWMTERFVSDENEQATAVAARREETDLDDIDDLLELGFQAGILDDLEDLPSPVAVPQQQQQHHLPYPAVLPATTATAAISGPAEWNSSQGREPAMNVSGVNSRAYPEIFPNVDYSHKESSNREQARTHGVVKQGPTSFRV